ncbi:MAG TPA: hypothetical protein VE404_10820, partial [Verrucomicrobiae bacterium]|nr:hypothetical protein [Verrucomicrobiae bacterium]
MTAEPAVRAWLADGGARREPERIEVLKEKRKSRVYRLVGAGENGTAVVAKRCLASTGRLESTIYGSILP